eukprot:801312-Prymnesium_polylepis.1
MELMMADFDLALNEVKPAFGVSQVRLSAGLPEPSGPVLWARGRRPSRCAQDDLTICVRGGMIEYGLAQRELMASA